MVVGKSPCLGFTDSWAMARGLASSQAEEQWEPSLLEGCTDSPVEITENLRGALK